VRQGRDARMHLARSVWRRGRESYPRIAVLQTAALPLRHRASGVQNKKARERFRLRALRAGFDSGVGRSAGHASDERSTMAGGLSGPTTQARARADHVATVAYERRRVK